MILTCPECATRYFVDGDKLGPSGRTVRCVGCGARWRADATGAADAASAEPAEESRSFDPSVPPILAAGDPLPQAYRAAKEAKRRTNQAIVAGAVWAGLGVFALALLVGAAIFRVDVVRLWPRTAGAYAKVGLTVNPTGLTPENVQASPGLQDGHLAVVVSGVVRNVETRPREAAILKVSLLDKSGHPLKDTLIPAAPGTIAPGQARPFSVSFIDPPAAGVNVQVEFVLNHKVATAKPAAHGHEPAAPHAAPSEHAAEHGGEHLAPAGPLPEAAKALPADSPYALPSPAGHAAPPAHAEEDHVPAKPAHSAPHG
ncbi:MAG: DUF3426 domain-containing protein [Caulobacteraceae bacterium]